MWANNHRRPVRLAASVAAIAILAGCSQSREITRLVDDQQAYLTERIEMARRPVDAVELDTVKIAEDIWLGDDSIPLEGGEPLPPEFETADGITLVSGRPVSMKEIAEQISSLTGIAVRLDYLLEPLTDTEIGDAETEAEGDTGAEGEGGEEEPFGTSDDGTDTEEDDDVMLVSHSGPLSDLLDKVTGRFSLFWRYQNGAIEVFQNETRTFSLHMLTTQQTIGATIDSGGTEGAGGAAAGGGGSSTTLTTETEQDNEPEVELDTAIQQLVGDYNYSVSPTLGAVTVTAPPPVLRRVARYIQSLNDRSTRQVAVSVRVYRVRTNNIENYGLNLTAVLSGLAEQGFQISGLRSGTGAVIAAAGIPGLLGANAVADGGRRAAEAAGQEAFATTFQQTVEGFTGVGGSFLEDGVLTDAERVLANDLALEQATLAQEAAVTSTLAASGQVPTSETYQRFSGSQAVVEALSQEFLVSLMQSAVVTTVSNRVTPVQVARSEGYIAGIVTETDADTDVITTEPDIRFLNTGLNLQILPRVIEHGRIVLMVSLTLRDGTLRSIFTDPVTGQDFQIADVDSRGFIHEVVLKSGSTLVLSGFELARDDVLKTGTGSPEFILLGGSHAGDQTRESVVIMVTPEVLESPWEDGPPDRVVLDR